MIRKRFFTLMEILIVMALIGMAAAIGGYNIVKMRRAQQFHAGVALVEQKLQAALETMLIYSDSVRIVFHQDGRELKLTAETEIPLERGIGRVLKPHDKIPGIKRAIWQTPAGEMSSSEVTLIFSALSNATPKGTLILQGNDSTQKETIVLKGYLHPIRAMGKESFQKNEMRSEEFYPKEVRDLWLAG